MTTIDIRIAHSLPTKEESVPPTNRYATPVISSVPLACTFPHARANTSHRPRDSRHDTTPVRIDVVVVKELFIG